MSCVAQVAALLFELTARLADDPSTHGLLLQLYECAWPRIGDAASESDGESGACSDREVQRVLCALAFGRPFDRDASMTQSAAASQAGLFFLRSALRSGLPRGLGLFFAVAAAAACRGECFRTSGRSATRAPDVAAALTSDGTYHFRCAPPLRDALLWLAVQAGAAAPVQCRCRHALLEGALRVGVDSGGGRESRLEDPAATGTTTLLAASPDRRRVAVAARLRLRSGQAMESGWVEGVRVSVKLRAPASSEPTSVGGYVELAGVSESTPRALNGWLGFASLAEGSAVAKLREDAWLWCRREHTRFMGTLYELTAERIEQVMAGGPWGFYDLCSGTREWLGQRFCDGSEVLVFALCEVA